MKMREAFDTLKKKDEIAFIPYLTAGFPSPDESIKNLYVLSEYGADIIEIGFPFSDPIADGRTIQFSSFTALKNGMTLKDLIVQLRDVRIEKPLVLMSYLNPLLAYSNENLFRDMKDVGFSGIIIPDLPVEESDDFISSSKIYDIDLIFLVAPTSTEERIRVIAEKSSGFIYCVSVTGTTGMRKKLPKEISEFLRKVRGLTDKPVCLGFGISAPEQILTLRDEVDGIIVGSRIIEVIRKKEDLKEIIKKFKATTRR
jgi:tryptophan synthase alpha chain